jgi:hypothetical protein
MPRSYVLRRALARAAARSHDLRIHFLQPSELLYPLLQRQVADLRHLHGAVDPVGRIAAEEVEVPAGLFQSGAEPEPGCSWFTAFRVMRAAMIVTIMRYAADRLRRERNSRQPARTH